MFKKINATVIFVENLERAKQFYGDTLGFEIVFTDDVSIALRIEGQDFAIVHVSAGVEMLDEESLGINKNAGCRVMLCVDTDDVDTLYDSLSKKGVRFVKPPEDKHWGFRTAYFADPEGILWELRQTIPQID